MRTLTVTELKQQINLCLWRVEVYLETGTWIAKHSAKSLAEAEEAVRKARRRAKYYLWRLGEKNPDSATSINWQWICYVLAAESWRFVLWLKERGMDSQQHQEEIELLLIEQIGKEIKRLGFQLAR